MAKFSNSAVAPLSGSCDVRAMPHSAWSGRLTVTDSIQVQLSPSKDAKAWNPSPLRNSRSQRGAEPSIAAEDVA